MLDHARRRPGAVAIETSDGGRIDYGALALRMAAVGAGLTGAGIAPGTVLAIEIEDPAALLTAAYGAMLAGITVLVLDPPAAPADRERMMARTDAAAILAERPSAAAPMPMLLLERIAAEGAGAEPGAVRHPGGAMLAQIHPSSGTTGPSKAAAVPHERLLQRTRAAAAALGVTASDRFLPLVDLRFIMGRQPAMRVLDAGGTVVARRIGPSAPEIVEAINTARATYLSITPSHTRFLLDRLPASDRPALPHVERLHLTGAMASGRERREIMARLTPNLYIAYGSNEVGNVAVAAPADLARFPDTVGRPLPGIEFSIADEAGRAVAPGTIGEVRMRGPNVAAGYLGDPAASGRAFREGWFHFGDTGWMNAEGYLFLAGRVDDRINYGGVKIYPFEIEAALLTHPSVAEAAAFGMPSRRYQEVPAAAVVLSTPVPHEALRAHCNRILGAGKAPRHFLLLDALPRNATGKVLVRDLRQRLVEPPTRTD